MRPRVPRRAMQVWTAEEVGRFLEGTRHDRLHALYVLAITTGLRQGKLLGLEWKDIDLQGAAVHVRQQLQEVAGRLWLDEPKTATARRRVDLSEMTVEALREHREQALAEGSYHNALGLVFTDTQGGPIRKSNLRRRSFGPLLRAAGLPRIRFHDLRHTAATLLLAEGVHPKIVQERLGHATISMTLDTYSHTVPSMQKEAAAAMDRLLGQLGGVTQGSLCRLQEPIRTRSNGR